MKQKKLCGRPLPEGGTCTLVAGWGTGTKKGPCRNHTEEEAERVLELKAKFLTKYQDATETVLGIASTLKVSPTVIWRWRQADEEFDKSCITLEAERDTARFAMVEDAFFKRLATGTASGSEYFYFLGNACRRVGRPQRWQDVRTIRHEGGETPVEFATKDVEQLLGLLNEEIDRIAERRDVTFD